MTFLEQLAQQYKALSTAPNIPELLNYIRNGLDTELRKDNVSREALELAVYATQQKEDFEAKVSEAFFPKHVYEFLE